MAGTRLVGSRKNDINDPHRGSRTDSLRSQTLAWLNDPWLAVADTNLRFAPSVSVRTTPVPEPGPLFVTVTV